MPGHPALHTGRVPESLAGRVSGLPRVLQHGVSIRNASSAYPRYPATNRAGIDVTSTVWPVSAREGARRAIFPGLIDSVPLQSPTWISSFDPPPARPGSRSRVQPAGGGEPERRRELAGYPTIRQSARRRPGLDRVALEIEPVAGAEILAHALLPVVLELQHVAVFVEPVVQRFHCSSVTGSPGWEVVQHTAGCRSSSGSGRLVGRTVLV